MKKIICFITLVIGLMFSTQAFAQKVQDIYLNGEKMNLEESLQAATSETDVPMREIFEALGAEVEWRGEDQSVVVTKGKDVYVFKVGDRFVEINGVPHIYGKIRMVSGQVFISTHDIDNILGVEIRRANLGKWMLIDTIPTTYKTGELNEYEKLLLNNKFYVTDEMTYSKLLESVRQYKPTESSGIVISNVHMESIYTQNHINFDADFWGEKASYEFTFTIEDTFGVIITIKNKTEDEARALFEKIGIAMQENFGDPKVEATHSLVTVWEHASREFDLRVKEEGDGFIVKFTIRYDPV